MTTHLGSWAGGPAAVKIASLRAQTAEVFLSCISVESRREEGVLTWSFSSSALASPLSSLPCLVHHPLQLFCSSCVAMFRCQPMTWHVCTGFVSRNPSMGGAIPVVACWWSRSGCFAFWTLMVVDRRWGGLLNGRGWWW